MIAVVEGLLPWNAAWVIYMAPELPSRLVRLQQEATEDREREQHEREQRAQEDALNKLE